MEGTGYQGRGSAQLFAAAAVVHGGCWLLVTVWDRPACAQYYCIALQQASREAAQVQSIPD